MPQFPFQPGPRDKANPDEKKAREVAPASNAPPLGNNETDSKVQQDSEHEPQQRKPRKFKSIEPKGPVTRVRISDDRSSRPSKSSRRKSPFKDVNIFEDTESLIRFRDNFGTPLALIIVAGMIVCFIYWYSNPAGKSKEVNKKMDALLAQIDELENQSSGDSDNDPAQFEQRIKIANQLLELDSEDLATDRGAELKLKTLASWATANLKNSVDDESLFEDLESTSREFINSRNRTVAQHAKMGLTLKRVSEYLIKPDAKYFPDIVERFKLLGIFASGDLTSARNLLGIAHTFAKKGLTNESKDLFRVISLFCSASQNSEIANIGIEARRQLDSSTSLYDQLESMVSDGGTVALQPIREMIGENIQKETISTSSIESILDFLEMLVQRNAIPASRTLLSDVAKSIEFIDAGIQRESIQKKFNDLSKRIEMVGKTFEFIGLHSVEGRPISRASLKQQRKIVLFWSPENTKSINLLKQISRQHLRFESKRIQVVAVATISDDQKQKKQIVEMSNNTRGIEFLTLPLDNTNSQAFINRMPVPYLPYWILLDNNDVVVAMNADVEELRSNQYSNLDTSLPD